MVVEQEIIHEESGHSYGFPVSGISSEEVIGDTSIAI